jgi:hypothetical protein
MAVKKGRAVRQKDVPDKRKSSRYNLFKLDFIFTDEPYWFRCLVILLGVALVISLACMGFTQMSRSRKDRPPVSKSHVVAYDTSTGEALCNP